MSDWDEELETRRQMFEWAVQALAQPAEIQRTLFPSWVVVADELALDFEHWKTTFITYYGHLLSEEQRQAIKVLDDLLDDMSGPGKPELWTDEGCLNHPKWSEVRQLAVNLLRAFGWPLEVPPIGRSIYAQYKEDGTGKIWPPWDTASE
jgi:hypothetical protein